MTQDYVWKLPRHIEALSAADRLTYCVGTIAVEWQSLVSHTFSMIEHDIIAEDRRIKSPPFSMILSRWYAASAHSRLASSATTKKLHDALYSYHLLRDALVHGLPAISEWSWVEGDERPLVEFRMKTKKKEYKEQAKWEEQQRAKKMQNKNLGGLLRHIDKLEWNFHFFYYLDDIEYAASHGLRRLKERVNHVNHLVQRETYHPERGDSPASAIFAAEPLPKPIPHVKGVTRKSMERLEEERRRWEEGLASHQ
jgi:hypothetical protein